MRLLGAQKRVEELYEGAAKLARKEADAHIKSTCRQVIVAGFLGPAGELFEPLGVLTHDSPDAAFGKQAIGTDSNGSNCGNRASRTVALSAGYLTTSQ